ncbi:MAG: hypothetical protein QXU18_08830 [Thermoplasmatales archaeon]
MFFRNETNPKKHGKNMDDILTIHEGKNEKKIVDIIPDKIRSL